MTVLTALWAEGLKLRHSKLLLISLVVAVAVPVIFGLVLAQVIPANPPILERADWPEYVMNLTALVGIGGLIGFGFVFSWLFGREYTDRTVTDLLALPISRGQIVGAKVIVGVVWCGLLSIIVVATGYVMALILKMDGIGFGAAAKGIPSVAGAADGLRTYSLAAAMTISLSVPVAWSASVGRGYLSSLGFVILTIVLAQFSGLLGIAPYFPWAIPGLLSGIAGEQAARLGAVSMWLPFVTGALGLVATLHWWRTADQT